MKQVLAEKLSKSLSLAAILVMARRLRDLVAGMNAEDMRDDAAKSIMIEHVPKN
jgi:hypothetical protein